jgi:hypothetical protein
VRPAQTRRAALCLRSVPSARYGVWLALAALLLMPKARATDFDPLFYGTNDYGDVGLLQTPTARMRPDGEFGLGVSTVRPYNQAHFFLQVLPWLETTLRYTDVINRPYLASGTGQSYKDKSADVKVRLLREGRYWPALALGIQDIGGTGLFSSEYLVGSYHWYDFDLSFGLGWGRLGSAGDIPNPFGIFGHHFDRNRQQEIQSSVGQAGNLGLKYWFTGKTIGPFGGVAWNTPVKGLALRVEYDGNDYEHEAAGAPIRQALPVNFGLSYRGLRNLDLGIGYERGNKFTARIALYTNFQDFRGVPKTADPAPTPLPPPAPGKEAAPASSPRSQPSADAPPSEGAAETGAAAPVAAAVPAHIDTQQEKDFVLRLKAALEEQGFSLIAVTYEQDERAVKVWLSQDRYRNPAQAVGRAARVLCATAPAQATEFTVINVDQGMETYRATIERADFEKAARAQAPLETALGAVVLSGPGAGYGGAEFYDATRLPKFSWDAAPAVRQSVGSPQTFYAGQLYAKLSTALQLTNHFSLSGSAGFNIVNNFNELKSVPASNLPHVRSDIVKYLQEGGDGVINLEADYLWSPYPDWYHRISAGIFEEMYGGIATELLYRPYGRPWAVSFDINRVKKRGFREQFDFQDYMATTGHVTLYYRPPFYNLLVKLSAGQYLAGDRGATLDISREFASGICAGVFATKTNVSAAQFGEGSFDKGVYIVIPLDLFFARSTRREASFMFRPLTRDGGQMVYDGPELYSIVDDGEPAAFARGAGELLK